MGGVPILEPDAGHNPHKTFVNVLLSSSLYPYLFLSRKPESFLVPKNGSYSTIWNSDGSGKTPPSFCAPLET